MRLRLARVLIPGIVGWLKPGVVVSVCSVGPSDLPGPGPAELVLEAQRARVEMIARVSPSVVCIYDATQRGGGSGVLIDSEGCGLTNYHVVAGMLEARRGWGGLCDGRLYELEVLGIDPTGDVAMFRLIGRDHFPYARLADSDDVRLGDPVLAMGNPFSLSEDYTPSVTMGIVTGVHRYQEGVGGNLTYTDCLQVDVPINPGNSGGPLFNSAGEVVGINGRISVNTRGRFNVGFGYAITANQIRRFIPTLRAGLLARHGTLQASVMELEGAGVVFSELIRGASAHEAGVRIGDRLVAVDGVEIASPNHFASIMGTYPENWSVLLAVERDDLPLETVARLEPVLPEMRRPFTVDREVNLRQVRRLLRGFQALAFGGRLEGGPLTRRWRVERRYAPAPDGEVRPPDRFEFSDDGDGPLRMRQRLEHGAVGRTVEYDDQFATPRMPQEAEAFEPAPKSRMVLAALYLIQRGMLMPIDEIDLTGVWHRGGGTVFKGPAEASEMRPGQRTGRPERERGGQGAVVRLLEFVDWPIGEHAVATFGFDPHSDGIIRIVVQDVPSGYEVAIGLSDYREVGGMVQPGTIDVRGSGFAYRDVLSDGEAPP